jgi:predicted HicB family RNase H-like nuclease
MDVACERAEENGRALSVRVPSEVYSQIESAAARELISVAAFTRRAVVRDLRLRGGRKEVTA